MLQYKGSCVTIQNYIHLKLRHLRDSSNGCCVTIQNYIHLKHTRTERAGKSSCVTIQNYIHLKRINWLNKSESRCVTIQNYIHLKPQFYIFITIHFPYKNEISTIYSEFIKNSISNSNISFI